MTTDIQKYKAMLPVMKHRLDDELEIQPDIMDRIATQVVIHNSRAIQAKEDLALEEARILEELRDSDEKVTVQVATAKMLRNPRRIKAWEAHQRARAEHEAWVHLLDAWRQKGYSIKVLADLYAAQYFSVNSHQTSARAREREAAGVVRMSEARQDHGARRIDPTEGTALTTTVPPIIRRRS